MNSTCEPSQPLSPSIAEGDGRGIKHALSYWSPCLPVCAPAKCVVLSKDEGGFVDKGEEVKVVQSDGYRHVVRSLRDGLSA